MERAAILLYSRGFESVLLLLLWSLDFVGALFSVACLHGRFVRLPLWKRADVKASGDVRLHVDTTLRFVQQPHSQTQNATSVCRTSHHSQQRGDGPCPCGPERKKREWLM